MTTLFKLTATAACILTASMASAQSGSDTASDTTGTDKTPDQVMCRDIVMMDTAMVPGTLYFIAGYHEGNDQAMKGGAEGATGAAASDSGTVPPGTDTTATGDAAATGTESDSSDMATDTAQPDMPASGTDATASDNGQMQVAHISGFYEIPVADVLTVCTETPDRKVSDVVKEKKDSATSDSQ